MMDSRPTIAGPQPSESDEKVPPPRVSISLAIWFWGHIRRIVVFVIGMTIIGTGIAMLVLPGPGWVTIFAGLALLATEFAWARWALKYAQQRLGQLIELATGRKDPPP